jgi:hypothetical protein
MEFVLRWAVLVFREVAIEGARLRFRPVMTYFAF